MATERFHEFIKRGDALYLLTRYKQAISEYEKAIPENGTSAMPFQKIGYCYYMLGKMSAASKMAKVAFEKNPGNSYNFYLDGVIKIAMDRSSEGIKSILRSLEINPQFTPCYSALSQVYYKNNYFEDAITYAKQGLAIDPNVIICHLVLSKTYAKLKDRKKFLEAIEISLKIEPDNSDVHETAGWGYFQIGEFEISKKHYKEALRLRPDKKTADALESVNAHEDISFVSSLTLIVVGIVVLYCLIEIIKHLFF